MKGVWQPPVAVRRALAACALNVEGSRFKLNGVGRCVARGHSLPRWLKVLFWGPKSLKSLKSGRPDFKKPGPGAVKNVKSQKCGADRSSFLKVEYFPLRWSDVPGIVMKRPQTCCLAHRCSLQNEPTLENLSNFHERLRKFNSLKSS